MTLGGVPGLAGTRTPTDRAVPAPRLAGIGLAKFDRRQDRPRRRGLSAAVRGLLVPGLAHRPQLVHLAHRRVTPRPYGPLPTGDLFRLPGRVEEPQS